MSDHVVQATHDAPDPQWGVLLHAFHEVGHAWGEWTQGMPRTTLYLLKRRPLAKSVDGETAAVIAAHGVIVQAMAMARRGFGGAPRSRSANFDPDTVWKHMQSVRQQPCCCLRGGDDLAWPFLDTHRFCASVVESLAPAWWILEAQSRALAAQGYLVTSA